MNGFYKTMNVVNGDELDVEIYWALAYGIDAEGTTETCYHWAAFVARLSYQIA